MAAAPGIEHRCCRILAENRRTALVGRVHDAQRNRQHVPGSCSPKDLSRQVHQFVVGLGIERLPFESDAPLFRQGDPVAPTGEVLAHRQPFDATGEPGIVGPRRDAACRGRPARLRDRGVRAPLRLDVPEWVAAARAFKIVVVDRDRLLENRVMARRHEGAEHRRQVGHVIATHEAR